MITNKKISNNVKGHWEISNKAVLVKLYDKLININILQTHATTADSSEEEVGGFYVHFDGAMKQRFNLI